MKKIYIVILSIIYTLFMLIGTCFIIKGSFSFLWKNLLILIPQVILTFLLLYHTIKVLSNKITNKEKKYTTKNKILLLFDKHPFIFSLITILILWLPYIIAYYPVILNPDSSFQIKQFLGIDNKYSYYVNLIDKNQIITNHHPVIHTLLLGSLTKFGLNIGNVNFGLFIYSIIQILILSLTLSLTIYYAKINKISLKKRIILLIIYSLVPVFPFYAMTAVKDVIYTCFVILFTLLVHYIINNELNFKKTLLTIIISILLFLFRNNGIYVFILTMPFLLIKNKNYKKVLLIIITVLSLNTLYNKVILPYFKVTPTSIRETLSIPFQQTARYVKYHEKEITIKDREAINRLLSYNIIREKYNPELADPVKNTFNKDYTKEDLDAYWNIWLKGLKKHPITYIEATIHNTYGYFYPIKINWYIYNKHEKYLEKDNIDYKYIESTSILRTYLKYLGWIFPFIPIIGLLVNIGFNTWLLLFLLFFLISKKKYKSIIYLLPSFITLLVCFASPANAYFRYAMPIIFSMPIIISLFLKEIK